MLVRVEELEGWKRKLVIGVPEADVAAKAKELLQEVAKDASAPGFRKGKVPPEMIERSHGEAVRAEALRTVAGHAYADAIVESKLRPICEPEVELEDEIRDGQYTMTATIEIRPEIELTDYKNLDFTERVPVVGNEDVEKYLESLREQHAELLPATRPAVEGDVVVLDYVPLDDNGEPMADSKQEDYICELGKGQVPPEIEQALVGVNVGDSTTATVNYPDDFRVDTMAGKEISFSLEIKDVREKLLPAVDDAFAKKLQLETVLDLRVKIRTALENRAKSWARGRLEEEIVRDLIERNPFELPECLVEERLRTMYARTREPQEGATDSGEAEAAQGEAEVPSDFAEVYRPVVEHQLKAGILLGKIAETSGTEVTKEDIESRVAEIAESQGQKPDEMMANLADTDVLSQIEDELWLEKVHEHLVSVSNVSTEPFEPPKPDAGSGDTQEAAGAPADAEETSDE